MKKSSRRRSALQFPPLLPERLAGVQVQRALQPGVAALEKQQKDLLEANRDTIGQIAFGISPERVAEKLAGPGLVPADPSTVTRLQAAVPRDGGLGR